MTALKTRAAPQFEVLLKLKQSCNEEFAFLQPGNELNLYYLWLKDRGGIVVKNDGSVVKNVSSPTYHATHGSGTASCINLVDYASSSSSTNNRKECGDSNKENNTMGAILGMYSSSSSASDENSDDDEIKPTSLSIITNNKNKNIHELTLVKSSKWKADLTMEIEKIDTTSDCSGEASSQAQHVSTRSSNVEMTKIDERQQTKQKKMHKSDSTLNAEQKARRLKRAKIMKGHFVLKMMDSK